MKNIVVRKYSADDIPAMKDIWNEVVDEGVAFPQEDELTDGSAREFFAQQTYCGVAADEDGKVYGMYIRTTSADAATLQMQAMPFRPKAGDRTSAKSWFGIA